MVGLFLSPIFLRRRCKTCIVGAACCVGDVSSSARGCWSVRLFLVGGRHLSGIHGFWDGCSAGAGCCFGAGIRCQAAGTSKPSRCLVGQRAGRHLAIGLAVCFVQKRENRDLNPPSLLFPKCPGCGSISYFQQKKEGAVTTDHQPGSGDWRKPQRCPLKTTGSEKEPLRAGLSPPH